MVCCVENRDSFFSAETDVSMQDVDCQSVRTVLGKRKAEDEKVDGVLKRFRSLEIHEEQPPKERSVSIFCQKESYLFSFFGLPCSYLSREKIYEKALWVYSALPVEYKAPLPRDVSSFSLCQIKELFQIAYEYSLVLPFDKERNGAPSFMGGSLFEKADQVRSWLPTAGSVRTLHCANLGMICFPEELCGCRGVETLDISGNNLLFLPPQISRFSDLDVLFLSGNSRVEVSPEIALLKKLVWIEFSYAGLDRIPEWVYNVPALKYLFLSENNLTSVPEKLSSIPKLAWVDVSHNPVVSVSEEVRSLPRLIRLNLQRTPVFSTSASQKVSRELDFAVSYSLRKVDKMK